MSGFAERRWTSRDGLSLYARDYAGASGAARLPVICLHGLTRNSADFEEVAPLIAALGRRVIAPDVRGRGRSDWDENPANYAPRAYAADVVELMDALGIARAIFVGTSMGGIITLLLAAMHRHRIAGAVLNDVGPKVSPAGLARIRSYAGKSVQLNDWSDAVSYVRDINGHALPHLGDADWERFAHRTFKIEDGRPVLNYDPRISAGLKSHAGKFASWTAWVLFRRLTKQSPVLVLRGADSDILDRATAKRMASRRNASLVEVPGVGHAPMLNEATSQDALRSFFDAAP